MKTVTIYPPREIFDDPEYCNNSPILTNSDYCPNSSFSFCRAFVNENQDSTPREFDKKANRFKKCQQCKELFKESLSKDKNAERIHKTV